MHVTCPDVNSSAPKKSEFGDYTVMGMWILFSTTLQNTHSHFLHLWFSVIILFAVVLVPNQSDPLYHFLKCSFSTNKRKKTCHNWSFGLLKHTHTDTHIKNHTHMQIGKLNMLFPGSRAAKVNHGSRCEVGMPGPDPCSPALCLWWPQTKHV